MKSSLSCPSLKMSFPPLIPNCHHVVLIMSTDINNNIIVIIAVVSGIIMALLQRQGAREELPLCPGTANQPNMRNMMWYMVRVKTAVHILQVHFTTEKIPPPPNTTSLQCRCILLWMAAANNEEEEEEEKEKEEEKKEGVR